MKCQACGYMDKESVEKEYKDKKKFIDFGDETKAFTTDGTKYYFALGEAEQYGEFRVARVQIYDSIDEFLNLYCCPKCGTVRGEIHEEQLDRLDKKLNEVKE